MSSITDTNSSVTGPVATEPATRTPPLSDEAHADRWAALFLALVGALFALFLLWEPISSWLRRN